MGKREPDLDVSNRLQSRRGLLCLCGEGVWEGHLKKATLALSFKD